MQLQVVPVTPFQQNCSVIWCDRTRTNPFVADRLLAPQRSAAAERGA